VRNLVNIFVVKDAAQILLLGMPFWFQAKLELEYKNDAVHVTVTSDDGEANTKFRVISAGAIRTWIERVVYSSLKE